MEFAMAGDGSRVRAARGVSASCPQCATAMVPKCGSIVVHHWAHIARECDPWWEPETAWHRGWKALIPDHRIEVTRAGHRADIVRTDGTVVELQHSPIAVEDIRAREAAYRAMVWLFDGTDLHADRLDLRHHESHVTFRWKHPRKHYASCQRPVYVDLGDEVLALRRLYLGQAPYGGWGYLWSRSRFVAWLTEVPESARGAA